MEPSIKTGIEIWDTFNPSPEMCAFWRFPAKRFYVERIDIEWHVLSLPGEGGNCGVDLRLLSREKKPKSSSWRHYLTADQSPVQPVPVLPDRPLVVRPDRSLTLLRGENALFFVELPVWFRLTTTGTDPKLIFEEPIDLLSNTWFGDPVNGELSFALATRLHQGMNSAEPCAHRALCPILVINEADTDLAFNKICLHVENLSVFRSSRRLWANRLNVVFKGGDQTTQIQIVNTPPDLEEGLTLVSTARVPADSWNFRKTFSMLKDF